MGRQQHARKRRRRLDLAADQLLPGLEEQSARRRRGLLACAGDLAVQAISRRRSQNHELQFISPTKTWLNGHFDMVAGLYYFGEKYNLGEISTSIRNIATWPSSRRWRLSGAQGRV